MGRPVNSKYFGTTALGGDETGEGNFSVNVKLPSRSATSLGIILRQRTETNSKLMINQQATVQKESVH